MRLSSASSSGSRGAALSSGLAARAAWGGPLRWGAEDRLGWEGGQARAWGVANFVYWRRAGQGRGRRRAGISPCPPKPSRRREEALVAALRQREE